MPAEPGENDQRRGRQTSAPLNVDIPPDGQIPSQEALALLAAQPTVWVRLAAVRRPDTGDWQHAALELTSGAAPPTWRHRNLIYPSAVFIATRRDGVTVTKWLAHGHVRLAGRRIELPGLSVPNVQLQRRASEKLGASGGAFESLAWPSVVMNLSSSSVAQSTPQEPLIAPGEPTFFQHYGATSYFFGFPPSVGGAEAKRGSVYRHQDTRARITRVLFGPERVQVWVDGGGLNGLSVEVAGNTPGQLQPIGPSSQELVPFNFPEGLPDQPWVLLRTEHDWLDRRFLRWPYVNAEQPDVEEEQVEPEPSSMIEAFLQRREGNQVEFKRALPADTDELVKRVMKTVAAFANGDGGTILFGITKEYEVIGIAGEGVDEDQDRLSDLIDSWVSPRPHWHFEIYPIVVKPGRVVLALHVQQGAVPPYSIGTNSIPSQYYVRHAARSVPARPDELRLLARDRPQVTRESPDHWLGR